MSYLMHYGIKGQKWGVRRFQNEDRTWTEAGKERYGSNVDSKFLDKQMKKGIRSSQLTRAHTIPKGTKVYRTTSTREDGSEGTTYISYLDVDRQHYKGGWIRQTGNTGKAYEHEMVVNEDIKIPSRDTTKQVVSEVMRQNEAEVRQTVKAWLDVAMPEGSMERAERIYYDMDPYDKRSEKVKSAEVWKKYVDDEMKRYKNMSVDEAVFYTMQTFGLNPKLRGKVISKLQSMGYNAMTDEASVGGQNGWQKEGGDPLIIFDRKGMFDTVSSHEISSKEENKANQSYEKQIRKAQRNRAGSW